MCPQHNNNVHAGQIIIVGGGPAGLATAAALVRHAPEYRDRVRVLEREVYPRDKYCAGAVGDRGWQILEQLNIAPAVTCERIHGLRLRGASGDRTLRHACAGRVVRRLEFDAKLADGVRALGVRIETEVTVRGVEDDAEGLRIHSDVGTHIAAAVVGAEGIRSVVRRSMGLDSGRLRAQVIEADTEAVPDDAARDVLCFDARDTNARGYAWDFPTIVAGRRLWCRGMYVLHEPGGPELGELFAARLVRQGLDPASVRSKRYAERGFEPGRPIAMGRRLLVGEAAGIDPISGEGIAQAIEYGALCGRFLAEAFRTGRPLAHWQIVFDRSRLRRDLWLRRRLLPAFYGHGRQDVDRALIRSPALLDAGLHHFAGHRLHMRLRFRVMVDLGATLATAGWRRALQTTKEQHV